MSSLASYAAKKKTWSPYDCLPVAELTQAGLLSKEHGEVELIGRDGVELKSATTDPMLPMIDINNKVDASTRGRTWVERTTDLTSTLTTHRIVLWRQTDSSTGSSSNNNHASTSQQKRRQARFVHLSHLLASNAETLMFKSPKIHLSTYSGDLLLCFKGKDAVKDRDDLLSQLQKACQRQEWEVQHKLESKQKAVQQITARKVGVDAVLAKNAIRHKEAQRVTNSAFEGDAENLLQEAAELVTIIQRYVATLERQKEGTATTSSGSSNEEDADKLAGLLQDMGMTSALSKADFRGREDSYYAELARQLTDFCRARVKAAGGVMTLTDLYCLYNRARGSNLISPEDLVKAVERMKPMHLGMCQRTFPSGVIVVQDDAFDDAAMATQLKELAANTSSSTGGVANEQQHGQGGITSMEVSKILRISALLAHEQLLSAEQMGYLARDDTLETIRFFPNQFDEWAVS